MPTPGKYPLELDYEELKKNILSLYTFVNGAEGTSNINLVGNDIKTIADLILQVLAIATAAQNKIIVDSQTDLPATSPTYPAFAEVVNDPVADNRGYWWKETEVSPWEKTALQPATMDMVNALAEQAKHFQLEIGINEYTDGSFGSLEADTALTFLSGYLYGNLETLPTDAYINYVDMTFLGSTTGEVHVLSPRDEGGTSTAAIYPVTVTGASSVRVPMGDLFKAGSFVLFKTIGTRNLRQKNTLPVSGVIRYEGVDSVNVGDIQAAPGTVVDTVQAAMMVSYSASANPLLHVRVSELEVESAATKVTADAANTKANINTSFLQTSDVEMVDYPTGYIDHAYTSQVANLNAYGPSEPSPGAIIKEVNVDFASTSTAGIGAIDVVSEDRILLARFPITWAPGLHTYSVANGLIPEFHAPRGSVVLVRRFEESTSGPRFIGNGAPFTSISTSGFDQAVNVGDVQEYQVGNVDIAVQVIYNVANRTIYDLIGEAQDPIKPFLIDERFESQRDWIIGAATISNGLVSGASATWGSAARCYPADYGFSELDRRTRTAVATIAAADQIWGLAWIRESTGTQLNTPAMIVDGVSNSLKVYEFDSNVTTAPELRQEIAIPWAVTGSRVRLTEIRVRFKTTWRLDNMVTGQSVSLELDYAAGTGATGYRPCGRPIVIFPSTTAGGVTVEHFRMVADYPFPAGGAARVILMGDSITENSQNGPDFDLGWSYLLEDQRAALGSLDVVVIARGGQRTEHLANCIPEMLALCDEKTIVIPLIGTNDALQGTTQTATRANIQAIVDALRTKTKRISVACLPPLGSTPNAARALLVQDAIDMYYGADLLPPVRFDLALSLNNDGETRNTALYKENTHPNNDGNEVMRQRVILDLPEVLD